MIRYALVCDSRHDFETWFASSSDYDTQRKRGFVSCPHCGSLEISKAIMAPSIASGRASDNGEPPAPSHDVAVINPEQRVLRDMIRAFRAHVLAHSVDVGSAFAEEARKIHYGEVDPRSILGRAEASEIRELLEEGIEIMPLPRLPDDRN